jgi:hypothetical protein
LRSFSYNSISQGGLRLLTSGEKNGKKMEDYVHSLIMFGCRGDWGGSYTVCGGLLLRRENTESNLSKGKGRDN